MWCFFEPLNRELRTCPSGIGALRISDFVWRQDWAGQIIKPGDILATVTFDGGGVSSQHFLAAPPGCAGTVERTFDLDIINQTRLPSQVLLFLS